MRTRLALMLRIFGMCFQTRPVATGIVVLIMVIDAVAATVLALVRGFLIERAPQGLDGAVLSVIVVGALFVALTLLSHRVIVTLQRDIAEAVELILIDDLLTWTTRPATIEHLQDPLFLDWLSVVVRRTQGLAHAVWSAALMLSTVVSVAVSLTVLGRIHPLLVGLAVLSIPPILLAGRAGNLYIQAVDKNAELLRLDEQLTAVATGAGSLKEILVAGSAARLDARARDLWDEMASHELHARGQAVILTSLGWAIYGVGAAGAVWWTIHLTRTGAATIGDVGVVAGLAVFLAQQIMNVLSFRVQVADAGRVTDHYAWIRDQTAGMAGADTPLPRIDQTLTLDHVTYTYPGRDNPSLDDVSITIPAGTVLGVVGAWRGLPTLSDPGAFRGWLYQIATRRIFDVLRARRPVQEWPDEDGPPPGTATSPAVPDDPARVVVQRAQFEALQEALATLPPQQRAAWSMQKIDGLSYDEIAVAMALPVSTVRGRIARARQGLAERMASWR